MKKLIIIFILLLWGVAVDAQTHTVVRGESLQSIAAKYNITEAQIIEANPGVEKLFYIGLILNIPENIDSSVTNKREVSSGITSNAVSVTNNQYEETDIKDSDKPNFEISTMVEWGFLPKPEDTAGGSFRVSASLGANYFFLHENSGLFAGARIGYNADICSYSGTYPYVGKYNYESIGHYILLPINAGYAFTTRNKNLGIIPYAGFDFHFCVAGSTTLDKKELEFSKKTIIDARVGLQLKFGQFNIGASYIIPLNMDGIDPFFGVNIGYGF